MTSSETWIIKVYLWLSKWQLNIRSYEDQLAKFQCLGFIVHLKKDKGHVSLMLLLNLLAVDHAILLRCQEAAVVIMDYTLGLFKLFLRDYW